MPVSAATSISRHAAARRLRAVGRDLAQRPRLMLAVKAAAAAALAWYLAPLVPFADAQYSYYAPLGVLLSMYPTLADSARSGLQVVAGLAMGIGLGLGGLAIVSAGAPGVIAVAAVIVVGVWLGGIGALGPGRELIAVAGLFVLLIGGRNAEEFSLSYLVTMAFGVVVGIVVNLVVFPPLYLQRASTRLSALRDAVADRLSGLADAVAGGTLDPERLEQQMDELASTVAATSAEVREAAASTRGNPRGRRRAPQASENADRLRALERIVFFTRDLADVLIRDARVRSDDDDSVSPRTDERLADAIRACSELVATPVHADQAPQRLETALSAVDAVTGRIDELTEVRRSGVAHDLTAVIALRRIIDAARPFV